MAEATKLFEDYTVDLKMTRVEAEMVASLLGLVKHEGPIQRVFSALVHDAGVDADKYLVKAKGYLVEG